MRLLLSALLALPLAGQTVKLNLRSRVEAFKGSGVWQEVSLPAGIAHLSFGKFLAYSLAGTTIWMGGLAYAGYHLGRNYELVAKYMEPGTKIVVAAIVLIYVVRLALSFRTPKAR